MPEQASNEYPDTDVVAILIDSSFVIALAIENDPHHRAAQSALGAVLPYKPRFFMFNVVIAETLNKVMKRENISAREATQRFQKVARSLGNVWSGGMKIEQDQLLKRYQEFSSKRVLRGLDCNDFLIVSEGMKLGALIITCDYTMYEKASKAYHGKVFFITDKSRAHISDTPKLIATVQRETKPSAVVAAKS